MRKLVLPVLLMLLLASCGKRMQSGYHTVTVDSLFSVELPGGVEPMQDLHDFASLQYGSDKEGFYLVGIREPKEDLRAIHLTYTLEDYSHFVTRSLKKKLDTVRSSIASQFMINGLLCQLNEFNGAILGGEETVEIAYSVAVYESSSQFYQLTLWTEKSQMEELQESVERIICSFQEVAEAGKHDNPGSQAGESSS